MSGVLALPTTDLEFGPVLVQCHGVTKVRDAITGGFGERKSSWNKPNTGNTVPKAEEVDADFDTESFLETLAHLPANLRVVFVEVVGKLDLGCVVRR